MKKALVGMFAITAITMAGANAAITQEQCAKSHKTIWVSGVVNSDGSKGACVPKNACDSQSFKNQFCNTVFRDISVLDNTLVYTNDLVEKIATPGTLMTAYVATHYGVYTPNIVLSRESANSNYQGVSFDGNYLEFEFKEIISDIDRQGALTDREIEQYATETIRALCIIDGTWGGTLYRDNGYFGYCNGVTKKRCETEEFSHGGLNGKFVDGRCEIKIM